jgi:hypothetical protein
VDYDDIVRLGLELDGVTEALSYGTPSLKCDGRFMLRLKEDGETIAAKLDWETHDRLLEEAPEIYFKTPHYEGYPALLARLGPLREHEARSSLKSCWAAAQQPSKRRP